MLVSLRLNAHIPAVPHVLIGEANSTTFDTRMPAPGYLELVRFYEWLCIALL